jgi:transcription antitermination factor NusA-like protein
VSRAIERAYRNMRHSAFAKMDDRGRDVCVDINVATGTLAILAQRVGRGGAVEWEIDDTEAFLEAHSKRHQIRKLAFAFTEEIDEAVSAAATESYLARDGEMVEATVVAKGRDGEVLLKLKDGAFACLPPEEAIPDKRYAQGDRVCALVIGVEPRTWAADKRAPVLVSCGIAGLLAEVLKAEVPEVADGSVVIKGVSRVSGKMSKVAVAAAAGDRSAVDPVLACVGAENARLRAIRERLGGEVCQILPWREDPEAFVAEALFPAVIQRVTQMDAAGTLDERGNARRMSKFVAYVNRFDEAKAIGAGGMNVKLAAALCGCFIMVERHKEPRASDLYSGGWGNAEDDEADDRWVSDARDARDARDNDAWASHTAGAPIDLTDDGLDELGWPDLEPAPTPTIAASVGSLDESLALDESAMDPMDPRDDDANWEEVGPGKVGVVTFGGNLGLGITGGCSFMGDPEEAEAERLGDAAEAAAASLGGAAFEAEEGDENGFFSDGADDADLFADDDLFGEDWNQ